MFITRHLQDINESYFTHFKHAIYFAFFCFLAFLALCVHSLIPFLFVVTGSDIISKLYGIMSVRVKLTQMNPQYGTKIAIIGFGASGIASFYSIVNKYKKDLIIHIYSDKPLSKGIAYDTKNINHLLNVRAESMSILDNDPSHFIEWLRFNGFNYEPKDFVPRVIYGLYLEDVFHTACKIAESKSIKYIFYHKKIEDIAIKNSFFMVENEPYHEAILCTGVEMKKKEQSFWGMDLKHFLKDEEIHILGCGLTAIDAVISIKNAGYRGKVYMHSRTNLMPHVHQTYTPLESPIFTVENFTIRKFIYECRNAKDWRAIFDSLRPITNDIWQTLSAKKKSSVLRHGLRYWNIHRHRCPQDTFYQIQSMIKNKEIFLTKDIIPSKYIDCTGFNLKHKDVLVRNLITNKILKIDDTCLGVMSLKENFKVIGANNFGFLLETTAIPELRKQSIY